METAVINVLGGYKGAFFQAYGELLTVVVEGRVPMDISRGSDFETYLNCSTEKIVAVRMKAIHRGDDTVSDWLTIALNLARVANSAVDAGLHAIAERASSLVVDASKIMKKMKTKEEMYSDIVR